MGLRNAFSEMLLAELTGEFRSVEEIFTDLIPKIPPGVAIRKYKQIHEKESQRVERQRERSGVRIETSRSLATQSEQIASGARAILNASITSLCRSGYCELHTDENGRQLRRKERRSNPEQLVALGVLECNHPATIQQQNEQIYKLQLMVKRQEAEIRRLEMLVSASRTAMHNSPDGKLVAQEQTVKRQYQLISDLTESLRKMVWHKTVPPGQWDAEWRKAAMLVKAVDGQKRQANVS